MKRKFIYSGNYIAKELGISLSKFMKLVRSGVFDFVKIEKLNNGKYSYHYNPLEVEKYLNDYKKEIKEGSGLNESSKI